MKIRKIHRTAYKQKRNCKAVGKLPEDYFEDDDREVWWEETESNDNKTSMKKQGLK